MWLYCFDVPVFCFLDFVLGFFVSLLCSPSFLFLPFQCVCVCVCVSEGVAGFPSVTANKAHLVLI